MLWGSAQPSRLGGGEGPPTLTSFAMAVTDLESALKTIGVSSLRGRAAGRQRDEGRRARKRAATTSAMEAAA
eukprot:4465844-Prymnesium_polylepis.1